MSVIEEAKKYSRLHKNNANVSLFEPIKLINDLIEELKAADKIIVSLKEGL